jgi:hypothetical protein
VRSPLYEHAALSCVSDMIKCTGFADLFTGSEDLRLTAVVSDGGNGVALPDLDVRCMGQQCSLLSNVTFCQTSQDCAAGMTCEDYVFDTSYRYPLKLATMDVVGDVLWNGEHRLSAGCCSGSSSAAGWQCADRSVPVCSPLDFRRSLHEWLTLLSGRERERETLFGTGASSSSSAPTEIPSSLRLCSVSPSAVDKAWPRSQVVRSGPVFSIKGLLSLGDPKAKAWLDTATTNTSTTGAPNTVFSRSCAPFDDASSWLELLFLLRLSYCSAGFLVVCLCSLLSRYWTCPPGPKRRDDHMSTVGLVHHDSLASAGETETP